MIYTTNAERDRVIAARLFVHRATCPPPRSVHDDSCPACPSKVGTLLALRHLDEAS